MFDNIINYLIGATITAGLYFYCDVPIEKALTVGFVAIIAYSLSDISRRLRKAT